ncbi:ribbon-helix-helix protein, CopG family [Candidatus Saganbacteria bacterium]|nr:ribbon-helix-helix protein, CopG family [Candidatus Saganbacteria bacterium]
MLSKRVQVLIEEKELEKLKKIGHRAHKSVGEIFREAVRLYSERLASRCQRLAVVEKMAKLRAPIADWRKIEKQIIRAQAK